MGVAIALNSKRLILLIVLRAICRQLRVAIDEAHLIIINEMYISNATYRKDSNQMRVQKKRDSMWSDVTVQNCTRMQT